MSFGGKKTEHINIRSIISLSKFLILYYMVNKNKKQSSVNL